MISLAMYMQVSVALLQFVRDNWLTKSSDFEIFSLSMTKQRLLYIIQRGKLQWSFSANWNKTNDFKNGMIET
jgi:hypothetical protein